MKAHCIGCDENGNPIWKKVWREREAPRMSPEIPYCGDCEHFRVAGFPNRMCVKHPEQHIWALGYDAWTEREENGHTQAEKCPDFTLNIELPRVP